MELSGPVTGSERVIFPAEHNSSLGASGVSGCLVYSSYSPVFALHAPANLIVNPFGWYI